MREVTNDELKNIELDILTYIDTVCKQHHLTYMIAFGTLLGAIRHKGFIPWDDDIDVCMPREDYNKFVSIMKNIKGQYEMISQETNPDYYFLFARIVDTRTISILNGMREIHRLGVFVDVFPLDAAPPKEDREQWLAEYHDLERKTTLTTPHSAQYKEHSLKTLLRIIKRFPKRMFYGPKNFTDYREQWNKCLTRYNSTNFDEYTCLGYNWIYKNDIFDKIIDVPFEDRCFPAPEKYDEFLTATYGDYMAPPPKEKQVSHHHFIAYWK